MPSEPLHPILEHDPERLQEEKHKRARFGARYAHGDVRGVVNQSRDQECDEQTRVARWYCFRRDGEDGGGDDVCVAGYSRAQALMP